MVRIACPTCNFQWNVRPDFDWKECVKCYADLPHDAQKKCVVGTNVEARKARMRERFDKLDISSDGTLDFDEMADLLRRGNPGLSDIELWTLYKQIDKDADGKISFDEFYDYLFSPSSAEKRGSLAKSERCPENAGAPHTFKFGKCTFCGVAQGVVQQVSPARTRSLGFTNPLNECPKGGQHLFKFAKCTKCGKSELG